MDILYFLQEHRNGFLDAFFSIFTNVGSSLLVIAVLCFIFWCLDKKLAYKICFTYFLSGLLVQTLKITFRIPRPWALDARLTPVESAVKDATGYSFPSGHTQGATGLYTPLALHFRKKTAYLISGLIIFTLMLSRMYLGCHTLKDVLVSFGITFLCSIFIELTYDKIVGKERNTLILAIFMVILSIGIIIYAYQVVNSGLSDVTRAMDAFKAAGGGLGFGLAWYAENKWVQYDPKICRSIPKRLLKFVLGMAGAMVFLQGLALLPMDEIANNLLRYALVVIWIVAAYPFILKKLKI